MGTETAPLSAYAIAAVIVRTGRPTILHLSDRARWIDVAITAVTRLRALPRIAADTA